MNNTNYLHSFLTFWLSYARNLRVNNYLHSLVQQGKMNGKKTNIIQGKVTRALASTPGPRSSKFTILLYPLPCEA